MNKILINHDQHSVQHHDSTLHTETVSPAEKHTAIYLSLLTCLAILGYGWLWMFPVLFTGLLIYIPYELYSATDYWHYSVAALATLLAGGCGWISYDMFKLTISQPAGRPLTAFEAPALRSLMDELCQKYRLAPITRVRIVREFTIELVRTPACGWPYAHDICLVMGLPLMQSLSARQLMAAIEREIVMLAHIHTRSSTWFYFSRQTWHQYHVAWQRKWSVSGILMRSFLSWYVPMYRLLSQSAGHLNHLHADQKVHACLPDDTLVHTLITSTISAHYLREDFWPHLYSKAYRHKHPPYLPYSSLDHNLRSKLDTENAQAWLNTELQQSITSAETPSLRQRLLNLGIHHTQLPAMVTVSAARYFLGENYKLIAAQLDEVWLKSHQFEWQQKYQQGLQEQLRLRSLSAYAMQGLLNNETTWELLQLAKRYLDSARYFPLCKQLLKNKITDARVYFDIGRTLLIHKDDDGVSVLEQAIALDDNYTLIACQIMTKYFVQAGNTKSAQSYRRRALEFQVKVA